MKLEKSQQFMLPTSQCDDDDAGEVTKLEVTKNLAKKIVASGLQNDAFLLANEDQLMKNCGQLTKYFSEIQPYFDVSCNTCPWLLSILQDLNFKFSCQSRPEFQHVLALDIHPTKIYFSNTTKVSSHMKASIARGVDLMIFNSLHELNKIQKVAPKARLILSLENYCGSRSGGNVEKAEGWQDLLLAAKDFGLQVVGVALTRNNNNNQDQFCKLIAWTRMVIAIGRSMGHDMSIVDIGPLDHPGADPELIQSIIKQNLNDLDVNLQGHVGTAFIENVFSCIVKVIGKRAGQDRSTLIINDGIFNSFGRLLIDHQFIPDSITSLSSSNQQALCKEEVLKIDIFGSSGDDMDIIVQEQFLNFNIDEEDWLLFSNMGAFSYTLDADMASVALPSKYGKFRIFTQNDADIEPENDTLEQDKNISGKMCKFFMDDLNTDIIEVIFLDVNNNNENEKAHEQCILELFEELPLPVVGNGDDEDEEGLLWADYLTNIH